MKYVPGLLALIFLWHATAFAQITITQGGYPPVVQGADSIKVAVYNSAYPALLSGIAGSWDLSAITDSSPVLYKYYVAAPGYTFADSTGSDLFSFGYRGEVDDSLANGGYREYGVQIGLSTYSLFTITSSSSDSLFIDSQLSVFSSPHERIAFPAVYGSVWSSEYSYDVHYRISVAAYAYDHAPGMVRTYVSETDSVSGWGQMRVKDIGGAPSSYWNVLQVRVRTISQDSIFLQGAPMSPLLLLPLGLTQGKTDTTYEQYYYRTGEVTPLASVTFKDAAYTQPYQCTTHVQRLVHGWTGVTDEARRTSARVYPNPLGSNGLMVDLAGEEGAFNYELISVTGQLVQYGPLKGSGVHIVQVRAGMAQGNYFLKLYREGKLVQVEPLAITIGY